MLLEEKCRMAKISKHYRRLIRNVIHPALMYYCDENKYEYLGFHLLQFEHEGPDDGKIYLDHKEIKEKELIKFLTF